jgi:iron-sulfur cluster assembly protein
MRMVHTSYLKTNSNYTIAMNEQELLEMVKQEDGTFMVTGDEIIGTLIAKFPKAAPVMMGYGLHCVGCSANAFDTVRQGAKLHGMTDPVIDEMIAKINETINKVIETVEITDTAIMKIKELRSKEEGKETWPLRIAVTPGGCAGFGYDMDFDQEITDDDLVLEFEDLKITVDPESLEMLKGSSIDYLESLMGSGFKIDNPNASNNCGCGKSFG